MTIYILSGFNNYYNRILKLPGISPTDYPEPIHTQQDYNFIPNDGIMTQVNLGSNVNIYNGEGDYLLVVNELNEIDSRWFIIESVRDRAGQYTLTLKRDIIADYYDTIIDATMYIEKATLNANNSLIFNKEGVSVNQIKTREDLLKDETGCAWIVGYYDPTHETSSGIVLDATTQDEQPYDIAIDVPYDEWEGNDTTTFKNGLKDIYFNAKVNFLIDGYDAGEFIYQFGYDASYSNRTSTGNLYGNSGLSITKNYVEDLPTASQFRNYMNGTSGRLLYSLGQNVGSVIGVSTDTLTNYKNKTLRFPKPEGQAGYDYYKVTSSTSARSIVNRAITNNDGTLYTNLWQSGAANIPDSQRSPNNTTFQFSCSYNETVYSFTKISTGTKVVRIPTTANKPIDAPYALFCLPLPDEGKTFIMRYVDGVNITKIEMSRQTSLDIAMELSRKYSGGDVIYDIQLLPYCPLIMAPDYEEEGWLYWDTSTAIPNSWTTITDENQNITGIMFHSQYTSFTKNIPYTITINNVKMENECDMYRLVSPNYNGQFEFNAARNGGVNNFNVDCTYIPYSPYIHLNPNFGRLYGQDFDDARGLICGGDFSLPQMNDKWQTYQIQNKNFQASFDRQISNMEVQHNISREQEKWQVGAGALSGAATGALAGSAAGPYGAIAGAVVGGAASVLGGLRDIQLNEQLRTEALDYTRDQFNYQLGNIQALPNGIMKTTAYTYNNKVFPIIEYYTCTDEEKEAIANKIAWNGMTVMAIGKINDYIGADWSYNDEIVSKNYIKGKLIRIDDDDGLGFDHHIVSELANELNKGVYFK